MMVQNNQNLCFTKSKKELLNFLNRPDFFSGSKFIVFHFRRISKNQVELACL